MSRIVEQKNAIEVENIGDGYIRIIEHGYQKKSMVDIHIDDLQAVIDALQAAAKE